MLRSEFREVAEDVFTELLPKVKSSDRTEAINELMNELTSRGLELEDDEYEADDDSGDDDDQDDKA